MKAYVLQHLVSSHNVVIMCNKTSQGCRRIIFHILEYYKKCFISIHDNHLTKLSKHFCKVGLYVKKEAPNNYKQTCDHIFNSLQIIW